MPEDLKQRLENLAKLQAPLIVAIKVAPGSKQQFLAAAKEHLEAARSTSNAPRVRFSAAAEAAHTLLLTAMQEHGYKPSGEKGHRTILFDQAEDLVGVTRAEAAFLRDMHRVRNQSIYDAAAPATKEDLEALIKLVEQIEARLSGAKPSGAGANSKLKPV